MSGNLRTIPVLTAVAYPGQALGVPPGILIAEASIIVGMMICLNVLGAGGLGFLGALVVGVSIHVYVMIKFQRNPHIENIWRAKFLVRRRFALLRAIWSVGARGIQGGFKPTRNYIPFPGNKYRP